MHVGVWEHVEDLAAVHGTLDKCIIIKSVYVCACMQVVNNPYAATSCFIYDSTTLQKGVQPRMSSKI